MDKLLALLLIATLSTLECSKAGQQADQPKNASAQADARPQEPAKPQPTIRQHKTWTWEGSPDNYAKFSHRVFEVGMGAERNGVGCADAGAEIDNVRNVRLSVDASPSLQRHDDNSFAGFMVDYHTADGYTKRVALSIGMYSAKRWTKTPIWGKPTTPDKFIDLGKKKEYELDLKTWAPDGWDGKVWFSVCLQNTGRNTKLEASLFLTGEEKKADVGQKETEKLDKEAGLTDEHCSTAKAFVSLMREAATAIRNAKDKQSVEKTSADLKRLAASLLDLNTKAAKLPQLTEADIQRLRKLHAADVRTMLKESLEAHEEFDKSVKRMTEDKTVPVKTLSALLSSYKSFLGAMATVDRRSVIGSWKLFVPQEGDITWDYFPLTEGQVRIYDTETKSPDVPGVSIIRDKHTIMKGGAIERIMLKTGAKGVGEKDVTWVLENNQKLATQSVRQHHGFAEIGTPDFGKTTTSWEPILKLVANDGDTWEWKSAKGVVKYQIQAGLKHEGRPAVQVTKSTRDPGGFDTIEKTTYVKNVGLVQATRNVTKEGKHFLTEVKRLVESTDPVKKTGPDKEGRDVKKEGQTNADKIVGVWVLAKSDAGGTPGDTMEFSTDGKLKITATLPRGKTSAKVTYKIEGNKLTWTLKGPPRDSAEILTIRSLTGSVLVTEDSKGRVEQFKRRGKDAEEISEPTEQQLQDAVKAFEKKGCKLFKYTDSVTKKTTYFFELPKEGADLDLANLPDAPFSFGLVIPQTRATEAGLKQLAKKENLTELLVGGLYLTDSGLKEIAKFKVLRKLSSLSDCPQVTDAGLKELTNLESITDLDLTGTKVTDQGLTEIMYFKNLTALGLGGSQVTDAGLKEIVKAKQLTRLGLAGTKVTDAGLKEVATLKNLTRLNLFNTTVTNAGLKELSNLPNLIYLDLKGTKVTEEGLSELRRALPRCSILAAEG